MSFCSNQGCFFFFPFPTGGNGLLCLSDASTKAAGAVTSTQAHKHPPHHCPLLDFHISFSTHSFILGVVPDIQTYGGLCGRPRKAMLLSFSSISCLVWAQCVFLPLFPLHFHVHPHHSIPLCPAGVRNLRLQQH